MLVNRYSASASEIFAAAIQDYGRGLVVGETTFGKGTVQSLLNLDDYATSDSPRLGQLKITMAQFFRVNGGSTQNRGVVPDIQFPSAGDPQEYGERSLPHALPWTRIEPAEYEHSGDLAQMTAVANFRYHGRRDGDQEFAWLLTDIAEYNRNKDDHNVSLLEATRRKELSEHEAKREAREAQRKITGPLVGDRSLQTAQQIVEGAETDEDDEDVDERPDLLLRESTRIVADMVELWSDGSLLAQQFSQLSNPDTSEAVN